LLQALEVQAAFARVDDIDNSDEKCWERDAAAATAAVVGGECLKVPTYGLDLLWIILDRKKEVDDVGDVIVVPRRLRVVVPPQEAAPPPQGRCWRELWRRTLTLGFSIATE